MAGRKANVELVLGARDETKRAIDSAIAGVKKFVAEGNKIGELRARQSAKSAIEVQLERQTAAYKQASADAKRYAREIEAAQAGDPTAAESRKLRQQFIGAKEASRIAKEAILEQQAALSRLTGAYRDASGAARVTQGSFKSFSAGVTASINTAAQNASRLAAQTRVAASAAVNSASGFKAFSAGVTQAASAAQHLNAALAPVAAGQARVSAATTAAAAAAFKQASALRAQAGAQGLAARAAASYATRAGRGPLGLRPYELTNLSFQINDVISGLAMGQKPLQIFAQQAGQIIQIFPRAMTAIFRGIPILGGLAAALAPVIGAMAQLQTHTNSVTFFAQQLAISAEGAQYSAEAMATLVEQLDRLGVSTDNARELLMTFAKAGIAADKMSALAEMAQRLADVTGIEVPEAGKKLADAFSGGVDGIRKLDEEMNFLTASQYDSIRAMEDNGDAAGALEEAHSILAERLQATVDLADGPWTQAWTSLGNAWSSLLDFLANTAPIQLAISAMNALGSTVASVLAMLPGAGPGATAKPDPKAGLVAISGGGAIPSPADLKAALEEQNNQIATARAQVLGSPAVVDQLESERRLIIQRIVADQPPLIPAADVVASIPDEQFGPPAPSAEQAKETQAALKKQADAQREINKLVDKQVADRWTEVELSKLSAKEQFIETDLLKLRNAAAEKGVTVSAEQLELMRRTSAAAFDATEAEKARNKAEKGGGGGGGAAKKDNRDLKERRLLEKQLNDLLAYRKELMATIKFYEEDGQSGLADGLRTKLTDINGQLETAISNMIDFWKSAGGAEAEASILNLQRTQFELNKVAEDAKFSGKEINEMIAEGGANAFDTFAEAIARGDNAMTSMRDAFLGFAADFLKQIGEMIIQQALLNALQGAMGGGTGGGVGGTIAKALNGFIHHQGGVVGAPGIPSRLIPASAFAGAMRYHTGGVVGLKPNERATITEVGEEILTKKDPRHRDNGGGGGTVNLKTVNVIDPNDILEAALSSVAGEKVLMNFISRRSRQISSTLR